MINTQKEKCYFKRRENWSVFLKSSDTVTYDDAYHFSCRRLHRTNSTDRFSVHTARVKHLIKFGKIKTSQSLKDRRAYDVVGLHSSMCLIGEGPGGFHRYIDPLVHVSVGEKVEWFCFCSRLKTNAFARTHPYSYSSFGHSYRSTP